MNVRATDWATDEAEERRLFTIGYEKRGLDEYIGLLVANGVALVIDVRKNPLSRKKGFSKKALSGALSDAGIVYRHLPELGIDSKLRKNLKSQADYEALFNHYEAEILPENQASLETVVELMRRFDRVALTCFELEHTSCHRHCVANAIADSHPVVNL